MLRTESIPNPTSEVVMAINVGDAVPDIEVRVLDEGGMPTSVQTGDVLGAGKVVLFAVPGAFTTGCTMVHLPTFVEGASDLAVAKNIKVIIGLRIGYHPLPNWTIEILGRQILHYQ